MGPWLRQHTDDPPCAVLRGANPTSAPLVTITGGYPAICGALISTVLDSGHIRIGGRNVTMELIGASFSSVGQVDRPVVDQTGFKGKVDYTMEWAPERNDPPPPGADVRTDLSGPTFLEALKEQLGLKLEPQIGPVDVLVIDHVEQPSDN